MGDGASVVFQRNHRQKVHKWLTTFAIIDQADLGFFDIVDTPFEVEDGCIVTVLSCYTCFYFAIWGLKETAILASNLMLCVSCQPLEAFGAEFNGFVMFAGIADDECAGQIHGSNIYLWIGPV
jgi:hypothetical protein